MPEPLNFDDTRCELCHCYGVQHDNPEHGGRCEAFDGHGELCSCPGFEAPEDNTNQEAHRGT